jgi:hypothetical protein
VYSRLFIYGYETLFYENYVLLNFFLLKLHTPSDDAGQDSLDEPGRICRVSAQLCKTNITLIRPQ